MRLPGRRALLGGLLGLAAARPAGAVETADWIAFRDRFVQPGGRVLDTGNAGQSHSEGQGWTLLFAARFDDRETFRQVHAWTTRVLRRPADTLHAWRCPPRTERVDDLNNASDGDLLIAWALLEAGARWRDPALTEAGTRIAADILRLLVRKVGGRHVLLPGLRGFERPDYLVVNPSYYVFPAFPRMAAAVPDPAWVSLAAHGLGLFRAARFGSWGLPPDWLALPVGPGAPRPAPGWPGRFSWDAVRVPLYMAWARMGQEPGVAQPARMWARGMNAWIDLSSGATPGYAAPSGIVAIARLSIAASQGGGSAADLPRVAQAQDYYSAALTLLARLAWADTGLPA